MSTKKHLRDELPPDFRKEWDEWAESIETRHQASSLSRFRRLHTELSPLDKAEAWLSYVADNIDSYGNQEALIYRVSRGHDCSQQIKALIADWKCDAKAVIEECAHGIDCYNGNGKRRTVGGMSITEASDVANVSQYQLLEFWGDSDRQELSIDATMLRTVEWCEIGGFDEWWLRLARSVTESSTRGGIDPLRETPKYIQSQLGHASIQTTLDRYGHLMPDTHREAAERLDRALFPSHRRETLEIPQKNRTMSG